MLSTNFFHFSARYDASIGIITFVLVRISIISSPINLLNTPAMYSFRIEEVLLKPINIKCLVHQGHQPELIFIYEEKQLRHIGIWQLQHDAFFSLNINL